MDRISNELAEHLHHLDKRQGVKTMQLFFKWIEAVEKVLSDEEFWALKTAINESEEIKVFEAYRKKGNAFDVLAGVRGFKNWQEYIFELEKGQYIINIEAKIKLIKIMQKGFFSDFDRKEIARLLDANKVPENEK